MVDEFLAAGRPARLVSTFSRDLPPPAGGGERLHVDFIAPGFIRPVRDPAAVRRKSGEGLFVWSGHEGLEFALPGQRKHIDFGWIVAIQNAQGQPLAVGRSRTREHWTVS